MKGSTLLFNPGAAVSIVLVTFLLLLGAACEFIEQSPPDNIPATIAAEVEKTAATVAAEVEETASSVVALITPEPEPEPTPTRRPTPTPTATPVPPTATPPPPTPTIPLPTPPPADPVERSGAFTTSLGSQVNITVNGFDNNSLRLDQLVQAINEAERLLGVPYPSPKVTMDKVRETSDGFCGNNQMSYEPRYAGDPYLIQGSVISIVVNEDCYDTFGTMAHEAAHTWFHGSEPANWIDEGLANAMERQVVAVHDPDAPAYPPATHCASYRNIAELERADPPRLGLLEPVGFRCNYLLGDGIFGALRVHYGDSAFNDRIARLARQMQNSTNSPHAIADVRSVLGTDPTALEIINTWYEGQPEMRKYLHLDAVQWSFPPTTDGSYLHFAGIISRPAEVHDFVLADAPFCSQFSLYSGIIDEEWVGDVAHPVPAGRSHHEDSRVITINHHINPGTGEFQVTARILAHALAGVKDLSLTVDERVPTGADGFCEDHVTYAQVPVVVGQIPSHLKQARFYHLDAVEWSFPPTIDGQYLHFAGTTSEPGMVQDFVLSNDQYCSQFVFYRDIVNQEWEATLSDPLPARFQHGQIPRIVVVNHDIDPATGQFTVTARVNDASLASVPDLSLIVRSRVTVGSGDLCSGFGTYSQVPVQFGAIAPERKVEKHYHLDAIVWTEPPTVSGNTLTFAGRASPGAVRLTWQENGCAQFLFYDRDENGYRFVDHIRPMLPLGTTWEGPVTAEVVSQRVESDGTFQAQVRLGGQVLQGIQRPVLLVTSQSFVDTAINQCGPTEVLSAIDIR